jgi:hypothetical protein
MCEVSMKLCTGTCNWSRKYNFDFFLNCNVFIRISSIALFHLYIMPFTFCLPFQQVFHSYVQLKVNKHEGT